MEKLVYFRLVFYYFGSIATPNVFQLHELIRFFYIALYTFIIIIIVLKNH